LQRVDSEYASAW